VYAKSEVHIICDIKARLLCAVHVLVELAIPDYIHSTEVSSATEIHHSRKSDHKR